MFFRSFPENVLKLIIFEPFPNLQFVSTINPSLHIENLTHFSFNAFSVYSLIILKICLFIRFDKEESSFVPLFLCLVYHIMSMRSDACDSIFFSNCWLIIKPFTYYKQVLSLTVLNIFHNLTLGDHVFLQTISLANNFKVSHKMWNSSQVDNYKGGDILCTNIKSTKSSETIFTVA